MRLISKNLSIISFFALCAMTMGCNQLKEELEIPGSEPGIDTAVSVTTTVQFDETAAANLSAAGLNTFSEGETIAVFYTDGSNNLVKSTYSLTAGDLIDGGKKASITVSMTDPKAGGAVRFIYPAAMSNDDGSVNYAALAMQDGKLETLAANLNLATFVGTLTENAALPASVTLSMQLAILKLQITNGFANVTNDIKQIIIKNSENAAIVNNTSELDCLYAAIKPIPSGNIVFEASRYNRLHTNAIPGKTFLAGQIYQLSVPLWEVEGLLPGLFTIDANGRQVRFSQGNLQAYFENAGTDHTWRFAEWQWDRLNASSANTAINGSGSVSIIGAVDLFGWVGASSPYNNYGINNTLFSEDYGNKSGESLKNDWGTLAITNGGNIANSGWRTLTKDQWEYLFSGRPNAQKLFCMGCVDGVPGVVILPDGCSIDGWQSGYRPWASNQIDIFTWLTYEDAGAVFLPVTNMRILNMVRNSYENYGFYWTSTANNTDDAYVLGFNYNFISAETTANRYHGYAVRLVRDAN